MPTYSLLLILYLDLKKGNCRHHESTIHMHMQLPKYLLIFIILDKRKTFDRVAAVEIEKSASEKHTSPRIEERMNGKGQSYPPRDWKRKLC